MTKKILISGMTAAQSSRRFNDSNMSFAGALSSIVEDKKTRVDWIDPSPLWTKKDVSDYDVILLGVAPVLSLTANKAYGTLSLIDTLKNDSRLTLFIDAPEPGKIHANLRAVVRNSDTLFKDLYVKRKWHQAAKSESKVRSRIIRAVEFLANDRWPQTIYPKLPWDAGSPDIPGVPENILTSMTGVDVDCAYVGDLTFGDTRSTAWAADSTKTKWMSNIEKQLMYPNVAMKMHRTWNDSMVITNIGRSIGALIGPHNDKVVWWSPRFVQSLNTATPVVTEWRSSSALGDAWSHLATSIELMSAVDRYELAVTQRLQYHGRILDSTSAADAIHKEIGA